MNACRPRQRWQYSRNAFCTTVMRMRLSLAEILSLIEPLVSTTNT